MLLQNLDHLLIDQLRDLYSTEVQIEATLPATIEQITTPVLRAELENHFEETEHQILRLQEVFGMLELSPRAPRCLGIAGLLRETEDGLRLALGGPIRDTVAIACFQRIEHYEIARYTAAQTYAQQLGREPIAEMLGRSLEEEQRALVTLGCLAEQDWKDAAVPAGAL